MAEALTLRLKGLPYSHIAERLGISRQRVQQVLAPPPRVRFQVLILARGLCAVCGVFVGQTGHVHHRGASGSVCDEYNDPENLQLLCLSCHRKAHSAVHPYGKGKPYVKCPRCGFEWRRREAHHLLARCRKCYKTWIPRRYPGVRARIEKAVAP